MVGGTKKWEDRKWEGIEKIEGQKRFLFPSFVFSWGAKKRRDGKLIYLIEKKMGGYKICFV